MTAHETRRSAAPSRVPSYLRPGPVAAVFVGATVGTSARTALTLLAPTRVASLWTVFTINVVGAFLLGVILERIVRRGPETPRAALVRLGIGTGVLGGFTTYSTFCLDVVMLARAGSLVGAATYGVATLVVGGVATVLGMQVGGRR